MASTLSRVAERLHDCRRVVALTGAGISAESGVPTFRGAGGLWKNHDAARLATPEAFAMDPLLVWEWYAWRRDVIASCQPHKGHLVLAGWERRFPEFGLVTQNVDGLHQRAGSRNVRTLHGDIWTVRCTRCSCSGFAGPGELGELPPRCTCGALLRPGVVWFGESLPQDVLEESCRLFREAEAALVIGTSGLVHPAAGLPELARKSGAMVVEINLEPTPLTRMAHEFLQGPAGDLLPALDMLLKEKDA